MVFIKMKLELGYDSPAQKLFLLFTIKITMSKPNTDYGMYFRMQASHHLPGMIPTGDYT